MSTAPEETDPTEAEETPPGTPASAPPELPPAPKLDSSQRRYLRSLAHPLKPIVFVGEAGISPALAKALNDALVSHELVKIRLRQPGDKKTAAAELATVSASALCGVVGHTVVLYRPHPKDPQIELPKRG
ncbi:MAG: YhbY family RNA-binding protein [Myxococcales bacterium]